MSRGDFGYGTVRDSPGPRPTRPSSLGPYRDNPFDTGYQDTESENFNEITDQISSNIFKISNNATVLERAVKQVGTPKDSIQLRDRIHDTAQNTNRIIGDTTKVFKTLSRSGRKFNRQDKLQIERLKNEFQDTVTRYSNLQKKVTQKVKSSVSLSSQGRSPQPTDSKNTEQLINWGDDSDKAALMEEEEKRREQLQAQEEVVEQDLDLLREREDRIRELESDILDINEIFKDLGALVYEQGAVIDTIEANVEAASSNVENGNEQLIKAAYYQKKSRKKMCIFLSIIAIILAVIIIIIVTQVKK